MSESNRVPPASAGAETIETTFGGKTRQGGRMPQSRDPRNFKDRHPSSFEISASGLNINNNARDTMVKVKKGKTKRSAPSKSAPESSKVTDVPAIIGK